MSGQWLAAAGLLVVIFGPGLVAIVAGLRPVRRAERQQAAARYARRGYEALDGAWLDSLPPVARRSDPAPSIPEEPVTWPVTRPLAQYRGEPL